MFSLSEKESLDLHLEKESISAIFPKSVQPKNLNILKFIMVVQPFKTYQLTLKAKELKGSWLKGLDDLGLSVLFKQELDDLLLVQVSKYQSIKEIIKQWTKKKEC